MIRLTKMPALAVLAIVAFGAFAFVQQINDQGWVSDDYAEVFNNGFTPCTGLGQALKLCGDGRYSVARVVGLPVKLYCGYWLGPIGSHYLQAALHIACALVFFRLLLMLGFSLFTSTLAAVIFVVSPWLSQAVIWWATMITPAGTLCILLAACLYVRMLQRRKSRWLSMLLICVLVVMSLCFYELWLFAPLLFVFIDIYCFLDQSSEKLKGSLCRRCLERALANTWPIFAVVALWAIAYKLTRYSQMRDGDLVLKRVMLVTLSVHLRSYAWITQTPWVTALRDGVRYAGAWWIALLIGVVSLFGIVISSRALNPAPAGVSPRRRLFLGAFLAWGLFLSSRLVFIFLGGVGLNTRHNHGGALGGALLLACLCECAFATRLGQRAVGYALMILILLMVSLLATASAGIRHHYIATSRAEQATVKMLTPIAADLPGDDSILVFGSATDTEGELGYFSEDSGRWLESWMRKVNPSIHCYVVPSVRFENDDVVFQPVGRTGLPPETRLGLRHVRIFHWTAGRLQEMR